MKKIAFLAISILLMISASLACATHEKRIKLTDGSIINGEVVSFFEGKYTVKSPSLGIFQVEASKIRTINNVDQTAVFSPKSIPANTNNPDTPKTIADTILNPDFQAFLKNQKTMNAAKPLDVKTPVVSEGSVNDANDPTAQEIGRKIKEQKSNQ